MQIVAADLQKMTRNSRPQTQRAACGHILDRRAVTLGLVSLAAATGRSSAVENDRLAGCVYYQTATECSASFVEKGAGEFPGLRRMTNNYEIVIGAIGIELSTLLQVTANLGFYSDQTGANAGAVAKLLFPPAPGGPSVDGTIIFGDNCFNQLRASSNQSAAIASIYAHEFGHILQNRYVSTQLYDLRNQDKSVARTELHADYVCGYYAAIRKMRQPHWAAVIQVLTQFRFGDTNYANPLHHGTPAERAAAVQAGSNSRRT